MNVDFTLLLPEFLLAGLGFLVLGVDLMLPRERKNTVGAALAVVGMAGIMAFSLVFLWDKDESLYNGL